MCQVLFWVSAIGKEVNKTENAPAPAEPTGVGGGGQARCGGVETDNAQRLSKGGQCYRGKLSREQVGMTWAKTVIQNSVAEKGFTVKMTLTGGSSVESRVKVHIWKKSAPG